MNLKTRFSMAVVGLASAFALAACGGGGGGGEVSASPAIGVNGEQLAFDKTSLTVPANQPVTVTFTNGSTGQQHNWVLAKGGDDVASQLDAAATASGDPNYIPQGDANLVAGTNLLAPGANGTAQFTLPAGTYTYLCTYPGHYSSGMKGTLTVQ